MLVKNQVMYHRADLMQSTRNWKTFRILRMKSCAIWRTSWKMWTPKVNSKWSRCLHSLMRLSILLLRILGLKQQIRWGEMRQELLHKRPGWTLRLRICSNSHLMKVFLKIWVSKKMRRSHSGRNSLSLTICRMMMSLCFPRSWRYLTETKVWMRSLMLGRKLWNFIKVKMRMKYSRWELPTATKTWMTY